MKEFDQAGCQHRGTVFKNDRGYSIGSKSHPRIKPRKAMENFALKNFNHRHEKVSGGMSRRKMP